MKSYLHVLIPALLLTFSSCTKEAEDSACISDAALSSIASSEDLTLTRTTYNDGSEWNIKMNSVAAKAYAEGIKNFPVNSMIVKEKLDANGKVLSFAVMYNAPADANAFENWLWSEYDAEGHVIYSTTERAMNCQGCHGGQFTSN